MIGCTLNSILIKGLFIMAQMIKEALCINIIAYTIEIDTYETGIQ